MEDELKVILEDEDTFDIEMAEEDKADIELETDTVEVVTTDYEKLKNLPEINETKLLGNKTSKDLGLQDEMRALTNLEIEEILKL